MVPSSLISEVSVHAQTPIFVILFEIYWPSSAKKKSILPIFLTSWLLVKIWTQYIPRKVKLIDNTNILITWLCLKTVFCPWITYELGDQIKYLIYCLIHDSSSYHVWNLRFLGRIYNFYKIESKSNISFYIYHSRMFPVGSTN